MTEPEIPSPDRALALAIRSLRMLALVCIPIGLVVVVTGGILNPLTRFRIYFLAAGTATFLGPGLVYAALLPSLRRQHFGAFVTCLVLACFQTLVATAALTVQFFLSPLTPVPLIVSIFWLAAMVQLLVHLSHGYSAIRLTTPPTPTRLHPPSPPPPTRPPSRPATKRKPVGCALAHHMP